jgi:transcription termination/antitermination protein NusG
MPVLEREPSVWPEDLFDSSIETREPERWCVFHVRPRAEKVVARRLRSRGIPHFLPQYERRKRFQRRLVCSHLPLFPGYVFVVGSELDLQYAVDLQERVGLLRVDDQAQIERELRDIDRLLSSGAPVTREETLVPGARARIIAGPLAGLCGHVIRNKGGLKFVLRVEFLQQGASLEVDNSLIEAI